MLKTKNSGFSLIEVLVSILIISIGLLGVSFLLIKGASNAKTASLRALAATQASSLASSMYANKKFWGDRSQEISFKASGNEFTEISKNIKTNKENCGNCTPAELAGVDLKIWLNSLNAALPDPTSEVSCPKYNQNQTRSCIIRVSWNEIFFAGSQARDSTATAGTRNYFLHIEL